MSVFDLLWPCSVFPSVKGFVKELDNSLIIAISFDECFNRITQKGKMDLIVRYWSDTCNQITSRYLSSSFMGKSSASNVLKHCNQSCSKLKTEKVIQVPSGGINVNFKFLDLVNENLSDDELPGFISIGRCGLHTIPGAFQHDANSWSVEKVLQAISKILDQSSPRRADFEKVTNSTSDPLQFCQHRWVKNENVVRIYLE